MKTDLSCLIPYVETEGVYLQLAIHLLYVAKQLDKKNISTKMIQSHLAALVDIGDSDDSFLYFDLLTNINVLKRYGYLYGFEMFTTNSDVAKDIIGKDEFDILLDNLALDFDCLVEDLSDYDNFYVYNFLYLPVLEFLNNDDFVLKYYKNEVIELIRHMYFLHYHAFSGFHSHEELHDQQYILDIYKDGVLSTFTYNERKCLLGVRNYASSSFGFNELSALSGLIAFQTEINWLLCELIKLGNKDLNNNLRPYMLEIHKNFKEAKKLEKYGFSNYE